MLMQLELCVLVNAVGSNAHMEEADTDFTFGYMLIPSVLSTHESLENQPRVNLMGIALIGSIPILLPFHLVTFPSSLTF